MCDQNRLSDPFETEDPENIPRTKLPQIFQPGMSDNQCDALKKKGLCLQFLFILKLVGQLRKLSDISTDRTWRMQIKRRFASKRYVTAFKHTHNQTQHTHTYKSLRSNPCLWSLVELKGRRCDAHIGTRWQPCGNSTHHLVSARKKIPWLEHRAKLEISINNLCATWYYTTISLNILDLTHLFIGIQGLPQLDWIRSKVSKNDVCKYIMM